MENGRKVFIKISESRRKGGNIKSLQEGMVKEIVII